MASELYVETLKGLTTGDNANKVIIPSGQTLDASAGGFTTPAGHVIQVVHATATSAVQNTTTSFVDTGLSGTITPTSTSSKILVIISQHMEVDRDSNTNGSHYKVLRDSTSLMSTGEHAMKTEASGGAVGTTKIATFMHFNFLDSPASTSELTYKTQAKPNSTSNNCLVRLNRDGNHHAHMTLMEIAG